jgi:hypothetical protein
VGCDYLLFSVKLGPGLALFLVLVFAIWIGWRWLCRKGWDLPTHDPYKDLAFYDLAEEQMVDTPQDAHCMVVEDPRETVAELDRENQTLGGRDYSLPRSIPLRSKSA